MREDTAGSAVDALRGLGTALDLEGRATWWVVEQIELPPVPGREQRPLGEP